MTATQRGLKNYILRLSDDERTELSGLIDKGKHAVRKLLKADASEAGSGWVTPA